MAKVTLDMNTFKALASDTRLDILRVLDGKRMSLKDISRATKLNKATLHEHLAKLHEAGLVKKKEREGHKWVYYKLTWKGEGLLHPENTRIVVLFSTTFLAFFFGILLVVGLLEILVPRRAIFDQDEQETEEAAKKIINQGISPTEAIKVLTTAIQEMGEKFAIQEIYLADLIMEDKRPNKNIKRIR